MRSRKASTEPRRSWTRPSGSTSVAWENDDPGMVVGWTIGIALTRFGQDGLADEDNLMIESSPGINNYMACGIADATAESFQMQASGWGDMEDG